MGSIAAAMQIISLGGQIYEIVGLLSLVEFWTKESLQLKIDIENESGEVSKSEFENRWFLRSYFNDTKNSSVHGSSMKILLNTMWSINRFYLAFQYVLGYKKMFFFFL